MTVGDVKPRRLPTQMVQQMERKLRMNLRTSV